ncbi:LIM domain protein [Cooperia oncophora]
MASEGNRSQQLTYSQAGENRRVQLTSKKTAENGLDHAEKKLGDTDVRVLYKGKGPITSEDEKAKSAHLRREPGNGSPNDQELEGFKNGVPESAPYASSQKMKSVAKERDAVVLRPVAPVQPKRHFSAPSMSSLYESVNANRQEICQLCDKVVYLAERMQVESMFVHKNCFRCAYCSQPLRIGECGKDKDLEFHHPKRFFCKTHLRLPLKEKIARIERSARLQEKNNNRDEESSGPSREVVPPYSQETAASRDAVPARYTLFIRVTFVFFCSKTS